MRGFNGSEVPYTDKRTAQMTDEMSDEEKQEFVFRVRGDEAVVDPWNRDIAAELAREAGIELDDARWEVVSYLRKLFNSTGPLEHARDLSVVLEQRFKDQGGLKYVYTLFPNGPVTQGCRIAGIPVPTDSTDPSFGTSA
jgi:tRNA 2-thiouridine synthesizing protein E